MFALTAHMVERLRERCGVSSKGAARFINGLWRSGRTATEADFVRFDSPPRRGQQYRVACNGGRDYLIILSRDGKFVTIIDRDR